MQYAAAKFDPNYKMTLGGEDGARNDGCRRSFRRSGGDLRHDLVYVLTVGPQWAGFPFSALSLRLGGCTCAAQGGRRTQGGPAARGCGALPCWC